MGDLSRPPRELRKHSQVPGGPILQKRSLLIPQTAGLGLLSILHSGMPVAHLLRFQPTLSGNTSLGRKFYVQDDRINEKHCIPEVCRALHSLLSTFGSCTFKGWSGSRSLHFRWAEGQVASELHVILNRKLNTGVGWKRSTCCWDAGLIRGRDLESGCQKTLIFQGIEQSGSARSGRLL